MNNTPQNKKPNFELLNRLVAIGDEFSAEEDYEMAATILCLAIANILGTVDRYSQQTVLLMSDIAQGRIPVSDEIRTMVDSMNLMTEQTRH